MLHLSLLKLPRATSRWRHLDPYQAHQLVWKAFPGVPEGERPFLFSLDDRSTHHSLLVQSSEVPDWSDMPAEVIVKVKSFDPAMPAGTTLQFFLRCNPTFDARTGSGRSVRRPVGLGTEMPREEALRAWLQRQGERGGFSISADPAHLCVGPSVRRVLVRPRERKQAFRPIVIHEVELSGRLVVADAPRFERARRAGLGRSRSFGYGLLMVKPQM